MNRFYTLIFILLFSFGASAQKDAALREKNIKKADDLYQRADFLKAYNLYLEILTYDTTHPEFNFRAGHCLFFINKTDTACVKFFLHSKDSVVESHYFLGKVYLFNGQPRRALDAFYHFKTHNNGEMISNKEVMSCIDACEAALNEEANKLAFVIKNVGDKVNSKYPDYVPLFWNQNGSLVFTSRRPEGKGGKTDPYGKYYEDVFMSTRGANGWDKPVSLSDSINTDGHDACVAFSPDGTELLIYRTDAKQTGGDIYISKYNGTYWSKPKMLGPEINSKYLETSACFSPDGNSIVFSSNRPGGQGGRDLYVVKKFINGKFSLPRNLGPFINSSEDEDAPFIESGTNNLYFSSRGHKTMGEYDIFMSPYNEENEQWGKPDNLGAPINSTNDDIYFVKAGDTKQAFFTSRRAGGYGDADIYSVDFNESSQVIVYIRFNYSEIGTKESLQDLKMTLYDSETGKLEGAYKPNHEYVSMVVPVTVDKNYKMIIDSKAIRPVINVTSFNAEEKEITITLKKAIN
jgi:hypothetical protein